jgi:hypothetical protein
VALPVGLGADRRVAFEDSRWRRSGTWASQQETLQNTRPVRLRLQVETLQTQYGDSKPIGSLQLLQRRQLAWVSLIIFPGPRAHAGA